MTLHHQGYELDVTKTDDKIHLHFTQVTSRHLLESFIASQLAYIGSLNAPKIELVVQVNDGPKHDFTRADVTHFSFKDAVIYTKGALRNELKPLK